MLSCKQIQGEQQALQQEQMGLQQQAMATQQSTMKAFMGSLKAATQKVAKKKGLSVVFPNNAVVYRSIYGYYRRCVAKLND